MKQFCLFLCLILHHVTTSSSLTVDCKYMSYPHDTIATIPIYCCEVQKDLYIYSRDKSEIDEASGNHKLFKDDNDVTGFWAVSNEIKYFPSGLDKIFKNIKLIDIWSGRIKEIHQSDLKPFPELTYLVLLQNDIETLEAGLFDYNPKLEVIGLSHNKITKIHPDVFDNLNKLVSLWLLSNNCYASDATRSKNDVKNNIKEIKVKCNSQIRTTTPRDYDSSEEVSEKVESKSDNPKDSKLDVMQIETFKNTVDEAFKEVNEKIKNLGEALEASEQKAMNLTAELEEKLKEAFDKIKLRAEALESSNAETLSKFESNQNSNAEAFIQINAKIEKMQKDLEACGAKNIRVEGKNLEVTTERILDLTTESSTVGSVVDVLDNTIEST